MGKNSGWPVLKEMTDHLNVLFSHPFTNFFFTCFVFSRLVARIRIPYYPQPKEEGTRVITGDCERDSFARARELLLAQWPHEWAPCSGKTVLLSKRAQLTCPSPKRGGQEYEEGSPITGTPILVEKI